MSIPTKITCYVSATVAMPAATVTAMANRGDFLDEIVDERSKQNPQFPDRVQAALEARRARRRRAVAARDRQPTRRTSARSATD
jgi:hypothetical protein